MNRKKTWLITLSCAMIAVLGITCFSKFTWALFTDTDKVTNQVAMADAGGSIIEDVTQKGLKKNVGVKNTGDIPCYVRIFVGIPDLSADGITITKEIKNYKNWYYSEEDGYYYFNGRLGSGLGVVPADTSVILYEFIKLETHGDVNLENVKIPIYAEFVQSQNIEIPKGTECPALYAFSMVNQE